MGTRQGRGGYRLCEWAFGEGGGWPMAASLAGLRDKTPESHREELPDGVIRENRLLRCKEELPGSACGEHCR